MNDAAIPSLSGALILRNLAAFERHVGVDTVDRARTSLTSEQQERLAATVPSAWIAVADTDALYAAIADEAGCDLLELYPTIVREGLESTLRSVWKVLLRVTTPRALLMRAPLVYRRSHSVGTMTPRVLGKGKAEAVLTDWPQISKLRLVGLATGIETLLAVAGRRDCCVGHERTPEGATFRVSWRR